MLEISPWWPANVCVHLPVLTSHTWRTENGKTKKINPHYEKAPFVLSMDYFPAVNRGSFVLFLFPEFKRDICAFGEQKKRRSGGCAWYSNNVKVLIFDFRGTAVVGLKTWKVRVPVVKGAE